MAARVNLSSAPPGPKHVAPHAPEEQGALSDGRQEAMRSTISITQQAEDSNPIQHNVNSRRQVCG
jgi:hypothetical protein